MELLGNAEREKWNLGDKPVTRLLTSLHKGFSWIKTLLYPRMMDQLSSKVERCMLTKPSSPEPHKVNFHRRATAENKIPPTLKVRKGKPHINLEIASQGIWAQCTADSFACTHNTHTHPMHTTHAQHKTETTHKTYITDNIHNPYSTQHTYTPSHIHNTTHTDNWIII